MLSPLDWQLFRLLSCSRTIINRPIVHSTLRPSSSACSTPFPGYKAEDQFSSEDFARGTTIQVQDSIANLFIALPNILLPCHVMLLSCLISPKLGEHLVSSLLIPLLNTTYIAVDQIPWLHKKWAAGEATILNGTKDSTAANAQTVDYIICRIFHAISGHMIIITCYRIAPSSSRKYHCKFRRLITKQTLCSAIISTLVFRSPTVIIYFVRARICQRSLTRLPFL